MIDRDAYLQQILANEKRAQRALMALRTYALPDGEDRTERLRASEPQAAPTFHELVSDLIADLTHLADELDLVFHEDEWRDREAAWAGVVRRGLAHYQAEVEGDD